VTGLGDRSESWTGSRQLLVRGASFAAQPLAERGQPDPAAGAVHELSTQLVFELANGLADARRRQIEPLGGSPEVQLVGQGKEDAEIAELDRLPHREENLHGGFSSWLLIVRRASATLPAQAIGRSEVT